MPSTKIYTFPTRRSSYLEKPLRQAGYLDSPRFRRRQGGEPDAVQHDPPRRSEEHTSELQSQSNLVCRPPRSTLSLHDALPILRNRSGRLVISIPPASAAGREASPMPCSMIRPEDRKSTRLNSSHSQISYAVHQDLHFPYTTLFLS